MIIDERDLGVTPVLTADAAVVGAGPAGIIVALELACAGYDVVLVESGRAKFDRAIQRLSDASVLDKDRHAPLSMAVRRQLGGTSIIWGGRCVPYDPVDFDQRRVTGDAAWPVAYDELAPFFQRACDWLVCGRAVFDAEDIDHLPRSIAPGLLSDDVRTSRLERWSLPTDFGKEYLRRLRESRRVRVVTGLTCTEIVSRPDQRVVDYLQCRSQDGKDVRIRARGYVIAGGGLESTRLLLASRLGDGQALGNHSGHLGRWYMGHVEGAIANVRFFTPPTATIYGYERDVDSTYVRRRFSFTREFQEQHDLPNTVAWLANPDLADARHRSGPLSFAYLSLVSPLGRLFAPDAQRVSLTGTRVPGAPYGGAEKRPLREHLGNILLQPAATVGFAASFGAKRFLARRRKVPGFFVYNPANVYPLQYHGEHLPHWDSLVTLSDERDDVGMPRLRIDLRFSEADVRGVVAAHRMWDTFLRRAGSGRLEFLQEDLEEAVSRRLGGGFHQTGTTRMSAKPEDGVVDSNLRVHGMDNLYVASSSTFVTSSQANSTFMIAVFAVRLADHLGSVLRSLQAGRQPSLERAS